jgi:hypothetical protein
MSGPGPVEDTAHGRHPAVISSARWLDVNPGLAEPQRAVAQVFAVAAMDVLNLVPDGTELTRALWSLIAAKDDAVPASLVDASGRVTR